MKEAQKLSDLAVAVNKKKQEKKVNPLKDKFSFESHQYVRFVKKECFKRANEGYGSVVIKLDKTTELFMIDGKKNSAYIASFVCQLLKQEGFSLSDIIDDFYDAETRLLTWNSDLSTSPIDIGMSWK